jgi:hypothetical protein
MDFVTGLPMSLGGDGAAYDSILVIVDRYTKFAMFIATQKTVSAPILAQLLYEHVECRFGSPVGIVSDRDSLFTSKFWIEFAQAREIARRMSTAFHPQTDGQTERTHQFLESYLRAFAGGPYQDTWTRLLRDAEFAYNNSSHSTIGTSPFNALYGYHPRMVEYVQGRHPTQVQGVIERLRHLEHARKQLAKHWEHAVEMQKKHYDHRHEPKEFEAGEIVGLSTKNFQFKAGRKLAPTYIRVKILKRIGTQAYQVALPTKYERMHDVFPVSLIEPWKDRTSVADTMPLPDLEDEEDEWEVEDIVMDKADGPDKRFLVKWKGWPAEYNTWEPREHLQNADKWLSKYEK